MGFEWDEDKNRINIAKHGVSFEDAVKIFEGFTLERIDDRFDYGEERILSLGMLNGIVILAVVHTDRNGKTRIISARKANKAERNEYEKKIR